LANIVSSA
jgi:hypothetical protein